MRSFDFPPTYLETFGNAHATIPADQLNEAWAPNPAYFKIVTTTARNYQLEAALDKLANKFKHLFPNPGSTTANNP